jgi:hypothetical protein
MVTVCSPAVPLDTRACTHDSPMCVDPPCTDTSTVASCEASIKVKPVIGDSEVGRCNELILIHGFKAGSVGCHRCRPFKSVDTSKKTGRRR